MPGPTTRRLIQDWTRRERTESVHLRVADIRRTTRQQTDGINDLRICRAKPGDPSDDNDANVVISLYRLRNPYRDWHAVTNPYIAIDTLELRGNATDQTQAEGVYDLTKADAAGDRRTVVRWNAANRGTAPIVLGRLTSGATTNPMATLFDTDVDAAAIPRRQVPWLPIPDRRRHARRRGRIRR